MSKPKIVIAGVIALSVVAGAAVVYMQGDKVDVGNMTTGQQPQVSDDTASESGSRAGQYIEYSEAKVAAAEGPVVLFFYAPWCPTCRSFENDLLGKLNDIPADVTILKVDYDSADELRRKHGVTYQHTFVQVDSSGEQVKKWTLSPTLEALLAEIEGV